VGWPVSKRNTPARARPDDLIFTPESAFPPPHPAPSSSTHHKKQQPGHPSSTSSSPPSVLSSPETAPPAANAARPTRRFSQHAIGRARFRASSSITFAAALHSILSIATSSAPRPQCSPPPSIFSRKDPVFPLRLSFSFRLLTVAPPRLSSPRWCGASSLRFPTSHNTRLRRSKLAGSTLDI
jgi:hypothetical protein